MSITLVKGFLERVGMARAGREERFLYAQADASQELKGKRKSACSFGMTRTGPCVK
jgi:hypothetical protein